MRESLFRRSTAHSLRSQLARKGISPEMIEKKHVCRTYGEMKAISSAPDFAKISEVLNSLVPGTPVDDEVTGVIIETRRHKNIRLVLENFMNVVDMPVQLFHGIDNEEYLETELHGSIREKISLVKLPVKDFNANSYNALLLSEVFWAALSGRNKILIFQTDALPCANSTFEIREFLHLDYIGSLWQRKRPIGIVADGGNGGLSIRDWSRSLECLRRFTPAEWKGGEDGYFSFHLDLLGYHVATAEQSARFSSHVAFCYESWGVHQPAALSLVDRGRFLAYCPEAHHLM